MNHETKPATDEEIAKARANYEPMHQRGFDSFAPVGLICSLIARIDQERARAERAEAENHKLRETILRHLPDRDDGTPYNETEASVWDAAELNTIDAIICRVHPDGADAISAFWAWFEPQRGKWIGPHRAAGAWLCEELRRKLRHAEEAAAELGRLLRRSAAEWECVQCGGKGRVVPKVVQHDG